MEQPGEHENSSAIPTGGEIFPDGAAIELLFYATLPIGGT